MVTNLLLLAVGEWLNFAIPVVLLLYALIQLVTSKATAPKGRKAQRRPAPEVERPLGAPQGQKPAAGSQQSQLNAEIEQFLKRAGQRQQPSRGETAPLKGASKPLVRAPLQPIAEPRPGAEPPRSLRRDMDSVAASVEKHLANRGFSERAEHLADDVVRAESQMEQHVKKAFARQVGTLDQTTPTTPSTPVTDTAPSIDIRSPAASIAAMLGDPRNVRQALVLNEILMRPAHRW